MPVRSDNRHLLNVGTPGPLNSGRLRAAHHLKMIYVPFPVATDPARLERDLSTVREITYEILQKLEIKVIFGNPGSTELPFLRDMPSDFKYVLGLHERVAAGMALGYAMATGKATFVNLHSIASSGNGLSTLVDAWYGHVPLVITTGQQDRRQVLSEPFLVSRAVETVRPYVKWAHEPLRAEDVPAAIVRGHHLAVQPPMGPVFLSIPMDDWMHECQAVDVRVVRRTF